MKKIYLYIVTSLILVSLSACGGSHLVTAAKAPAPDVRLPTSLAQDKDAIYYSTLLNQYLLDASNIPATQKVVSKEEQKKIDKKSKKDFISSFEKVGLSKEAGLKAYKKFKKDKLAAKELAVIPEDAISGMLMGTKGTTNTLMGKTVSSKDGYTVFVSYEFTDKESMMKKYKELAQMFTIMLPASQKYKLSNEVILKAMMDKSVENMESTYEEYKNYPHIIPDKEAYKKSIEATKQQALNLKDKPFTSFQYGWNSDLKVGGAMTGAYMPNLLLITIRPMAKGYTEETVKDTLSISFVKTEY